MDIVVSNSSPKPIYRQIYEQVCAQILRGELAPEECLPSIRTVALELRISVITVKKAWEELERGGFLDTVAGKGCFVARLGERELGEKREALALGRLENDIEYYKELGITRDQFIELIARCYQADSPEK